MTPNLIIERPDTPPKEGEVVYKAYGGALELLYSHDPEILIEGPSGTGKSRACLEKFHLCASKYPNMRAAVVRKTRESLTQSILVTYEKKVLPPNSPVKFHYEDQEYRYPNGSVIAVAGMDKESRIMSSDYDMIYVAEATELSESEVEYLSTRLRNNIVPYQQIIMDCNPDAPSHWLNQRCTRSITRRIISRHEDNPTITPEYMAKLDNLSGYRYKRLRLGLWVAAEGVFFTEWDESVHLIDPFDIPKDWTRWVALDYGFADPFCTLWFARDPKDKHHIYLYRESYQTGLRDEEQAQLVHRLSKEEKVRWFVADPSMFNKRTEQNKPSIAWIYAKNHVRPIVPGVNERIAGWQTVRRCLAWDEDKPNPRLLVMKGRAPNLIRTLPMMVHDPLDSEDLADKIRGVKTEDHGVDCLRYGLMFESMPDLQTARMRDFAVREDYS